MLTKPYVRVRPVEPHEAAQVIDAVFDGLSLESRRLRFHVPMPRLPTSFREQLARLDGRNHAAIAARIDGDVIGVGRLVGVSAMECEMAMAVADRWQGQGIGRSILGELIDLAIGYGYERMIADVLMENTAMLSLLADFFPEADSSRERGVMRLECSLIDRAPALPRQRVPALATA